MSDFDVVRQAAPEDKPAEGFTSYQKPEEVALSEELFEDFKSARAPWIQQGALDSDFRDGAQWTADEIAMLEAHNMAPSVVNVIHPALEGLKASLTANKPKFSSAGREGSDLKVASMFSNIIAWIWDHSLGNVQLKKAIEDYAVKGMGVFMVYVDQNADSGKGEVCFKHVSTDEVYVDPNSKDIFFSDAGHIILSSVVTRAQLQNMYPDIFRYGTPPMEQTNEEDVEISDRVGIEGQGTGLTPNDQMQTKYRIIDRYSKVKEEVYHVYEKASGYERELSALEYAEWLRETAYVEFSKNAEPKYLVTPAQVRGAEGYVKQTGGIFHYGVPMGDMSGEPVMLKGPEDKTVDEMLGFTTIPGSEIRLVTVSMMDLVKARALTVETILVDRILRVYSIGGWLYYKNVGKTSLYPIIPLMNRHNGNPYPMSDVRFVRPLQIYINKLRSLIVAHASNSTSVKLLVPRGGVNINELRTEWGKAGTAVVEYDAEIGIPIVAGPVPLPGELYRNEQTARNDVQEIFGVYTLSQGDPGGAPDTFKGTVAIDEYGQRRMKSKKDDIEEFLNQLCRVVVQLVQATYTEHKTLRLIRPNNVPFTLELNSPMPETVEDLSDEVVKVGDITVGRYDVVAISGSTLPLNRWARFEYYKQLYELQIIDQVEVLKQTEVADMEGVLKRTSQIKILQGQLQQAVQEIKKLQGDLQTAEREAVHANQRVELEKYKTELDKLSNKAEAATHLYGARLTDSVQNVKTRLAAEEKAKKSAAKPKPKGK